MKRPIAILLACIVLAVAGCRNDPQPDKAATGSSSAGAALATSDQKCSDLDPVKQRYPEVPEPQGLPVTVAELRKHLGCLYVAAVQKAQTGSAMTVIYVTPYGRFTQFVSGASDASQAWKRLHQPQYPGAPPQSERMEPIGTQSNGCNETVKLDCLGLLGANQKGDPQTYTELYIYNRARKQLAALGADATLPFADRGALVSLAQEVALK